MIGIEHLEFKPLSERKKLAWDKAQKSIDGKAIEYYKQKRILSGKAEIAALNIVVS